ncbi:hypothetical protein ES703_126004 [subsurface metagenome]
MIILLGPDASGKTTLAKKLGLPYYHFDYNSKYEDYLKPLCSLELSDAVLDRHMICEYAYSNVMHRQPAFSMKQWHNIILLSLIQNPLVVLCTHKPYPAQYKKEQYLPYDQWDRCLILYRHFLSTHYIRYVEYDYAGPVSIHALELMHEKNKAGISWWKPMWEAGYGCIGSTYPKVLLVAERLGPNNVNNLPFETGPTGYMLSDMLAKTGTPLGKFSVTNLVKSFRRDTRSLKKSDYDMLYIELSHLNPDRVVFMGSVAKLGVRMAKEMGIKHHEIVHLGYYHHKRITNMIEYYDNWRNIMGITP